MCVLEGIFWDNLLCFRSLGNFPGIGLFLLKLWVLVLEAKDCCENFIEMQVLACRGTVVTLHMQCAIWQKFTV